MIKRLTKHGNSRALVFDKTLTELLHIDEHTPLELRVEGHRLIITPIEQTSREDRIARALEKANTRYGETLKKLAE